jgi:hypothetical protein
LNYEKHVVSPSFPIIFHKAHPERWNADYNICKNEAFRIFKWEKTPIDMYNEVVKYTTHFTQEDINKIL